MPRRHGFTLIELLVVVAIIAALIAVLLPSLGKAKDTAEAVVCASNQRQIGIAITIYSQSYRGYYPSPSVYYAPTPPPNLGVSWDDMLADVDGRNLTFADMDDWRLPRTGHAAGSTSAVYMCPSGLDVDNVHLSRAFKMIRGGRNPSTGSYGRRSFEVEAPASTLLLAETIITYLGHSGPGGYYNFTDNPPSQLAYHPTTAAIDMQTHTPRHADRTKWNYLMCDGHVELLQPIETVSASYINGNWMQVANDKSPGRMWSIAAD